MKEEEKPSQYEKRTDEEAKLIKEFKYILTTLISKADMDSKYQACKLGMTVLKILEHEELNAMQVFNLLDQSFKEASMQYAMKKKAHRLGLINLGTLVDAKDKKKFARTMIEEFVNIKKADDD